MLPPLQHIPSTKQNKWRLQVNVYREILERHYGMEVEAMAMLALHGDNPEAEVHMFERDTGAAILLDKRRVEVGAPVWTKT